MKDSNRINILLNEYSNFYLGVIRSELLLKALKTLPVDMVLQANTMPGLPPNMQKPKTVANRIEEVERDYKVLEARLKAAKELLEAEDGRGQALKQWVWEKPLTSDN